MKKAIRYIGPSAAVTIGTIPLTAGSYGTIPLISFFLNLVVLPLMDIFVPMALLSGALSLFSNTAAAFGGGSIHFVLQMNRMLCEKMLRFPLSGLGGQVCRRFLDFHLLWDADRVCIDVIAGA